MGSARRKRKNKEIIKEVKYYGNEGFAKQGWITLPYTSVPGRDQQALFIGDFLIAAGLFYLGYEIGNATDELGKRWDRTNQVLQELTDAVKSIAQDVHKIVELLSALPAELAGALNANTLNQALASALASLAILHDYFLNPAYTNDHLTEVEKELDNLLHQIYVFYVFQGASALVHAAPLVAGWTQTNTNYQMLLRSQGKPWINPYKTQLHLDTVSQLRTFIGDYGKQKFSNLFSWQDLAKQGVVSVFQGAAFKDTNIPFSESYPFRPTRAGLFSVRKQVTEPSPEGDYLVSTYLSEDGIWCWRSVFIPTSWPMPALSRRPRTGGLPKNLSTTGSSSSM